ncbi:MAG: hypothetical protein HKP25_04220 [Marinicaulis sp.]|nr:hypothetical protein [Marinicaulis sp.]NNL88252.1 hypothetical protein [Marinicaulis sp.]
MKYLRLALGVIAGLAIVSVIVEVIEVAIVMSKTGLALKELEHNQDAYFEARNAPVILISKLIYTFVAALISGWVAARVAGTMARVAIGTLITIQIVAIIWGGFFSEWSSTAPKWLWLALVPTITAGFLYGGQVRNRKTG